MCMRKLAGYLLVGTLGAFAVGRFTSSYVMKRFHPDKMLGVFAITNILLLLIGILWTGWVGLIAVLLTSFFMSAHVPHHLRAGHQGPGRAYERRRVAAGDGALLAEGFSR